MVALMTVMFATASEEWMPGVGLVSLVTALITGGIGGGGAVGLSMTWMYMKHLSTRDEALHKLIDSVSARNALLTDKILTMLEKR